MNIYLSIPEPHIVFHDISAPQNRTKLVLYSKFTYVSQFSEEKNGLEICSFVPEIFNKQTFERFF